MSEYVFKSGVYFPIPKLKGAKTEDIVALFSRIGCIPEDYGADFERDEGDPLYFKEDLEAFHPRQDDEDNWILEYVVCSDSIDDINPYFAIDADTINELVYYLLEKLEMRLDPIPFTYVWWSGSDEPFVKPIKVSL
jgi:hypothetical protein